MNNVTCVAKYEDGDYQCACAAGYVGKHCKIGISTHQFGILDCFLTFLTVLLYLICGRRGSLMVSALVSGSSGPGSSPGRGGDIVLCS